MLSNELPTTLTKSIPQQSTCNCIVLSISNQTWCTDKHSPFQTCICFKSVFLGLSSSQVTQVNNLLPSSLYEQFLPENHCILTLTRVLASFAVPNISEKRCSHKCNNTTRQRPELINSQSALKEIKRNIQNVSNTSTYMIQVEQQLDFNGIITDSSLGVPKE